MLWALKLLERARTEGKITIEAPVWASLIGGFEYLEINNNEDFYKKISGENKTRLLQIVQFGSVKVKYFQKILHHSL